MSDTTSPSGYALTLAVRSLSEVGDVLGCAHGSDPIVCILKNPTDVYGPAEATAGAVKEITEKYAEGYTYSRRAEVRWKAAGSAEDGFRMLVLTEDLNLASSLDKSRGKGESNRKMKVTFYKGYYGEKEKKQISSVNFWLPTETRLPGRHEYPVDLFRSYAVYRDAKTHAAEFTRLIPE